MSRTRAALDRGSSRPPYLALFVVGLGGLFAGVTGPLLSTFVPPLVRDALGEHRTLIGAVMAIDNVLLLLLVPWAGAASDRASAHGRGRLAMVLAGFVLASIGMALFPWSAAFGISGVIAAIVLLYSGVNIQRSPFQALLADLIPSRDRSLATGSITFQMCAGAIVFLMLGRLLGMKPAFLIAAGTVLIIAAVFAAGLREPAHSEAAAAEATFHSLAEAAWSALRGTMPGMRAIFLASLLLQLTFQTFTTWYALHGTERFGVGPEDVTIGFIAWALGGVLGALPAGVIGVRVGRRTAMLIGFGLMAACLVALDRVSTIAQATPLLALASASWTLPTVNGYPLFVEPIPRARRGVLAALFLLCNALGGAVGDPLNGAFFDLVGGYRPLFLLMAGYTAMAFVAVLFVPKGAGEADTGPESIRPGPADASAARLDSAGAGSLPSRTGRPGVDCGVKLAGILSSVLLSAGLTAAAVAGQAPPGGVTEAARTPTLVPGVDHVIDAAVGNHFFAVARADGTVMTWGYNNFGQLGTGTIGPLAGSDPGKTMGFVVEGRAQAIEGLTEVVGVAAGGDHALAVRRDGSVWGWGSNGSGQLALGRANRAGNPRPVAIPGITTAVAVAAYNSASYALLSDGTVL